MNDIKPAVSIIVTVYNAEKYIRECLDSALKQTLHSIEIICIDGKSTDNTCSIIDSYKAVDNRIKLFTQDRPGIGAAKNCGIEHSAGEFITFLDADDFYVDPSALEKMYVACKEHNVKVCGAYRSTLFMDGSVSNESLHRDDCKANPDGVLLRYIDKQYDYHFHSYLYDLDMILNSDARFAEVKAYDDTHFFIRAMLAAETFYVVPVELYRYRCGPAYDWGMEKAEDAVLTLTDQLRLSKEKKLAQLHWLTLQRINYEYGQIFVKNIKAGDYELLCRLLKANDEVDTALIRVAIKEGIPEKSYLEPMMHRGYADMPLRYAGDEKNGQYILEPIWDLLVKDGLNFAEVLKPSNQLRPELSYIRESKAYAIACAVANKNKDGAKLDMVTESPLEIINDNRLNTDCPKVTIVVPVFNVKKYLAECLDSILGQTLKEIEILCGDGGSDDGSLEILREYAQRDKRITVISRKGSGYGQSVNECMDMAKGEYIGIVESDDVVKPETYEILYRKAREEDVDWIRGDIYYYYSGMPEGEQLKRESIIYEADFYNMVLDPQKDYRPYKSGLRTWSGIYKRKFLDENKIRHNETPGGSYQDVGFYLKTLYYARRVYFINQAFYMWRQDNPGSSIHYNAAKLVEHSLTEWHLNYEYLKAHPELPHRAVESYRYRQFFSYMWTLDMADDAIRAQTRDTIRREFEEGIKKNEYDKAFFEPWEWERFQEFLASNEADVPKEPRNENTGSLKLKKVIKRVLRPLANVFRKVVEKSMRNVMWKQQWQFETLLRRINETAEDTQWLIRESVEAKHREVGAAILKSAYEKLEEDVCSMNAQISAFLKDASTIADSLQTQISLLSVLNKRNEDIYKELCQKMTDQGDTVWQVKCRGEDIYDKVSETRQKVLDQGDLLWDVRCRQRDVEKFIRDAADAQMIHTLMLKDSAQILQGKKWDSLYDMRFFWNNCYGSMCSGQIVLEAVFSKFSHESVVDFGCGTGTWLRAAKMLGADRVLGIDGDYVPRSLLLIQEKDFISADLENPVHLHEKFDLAISVEVAEHLHEEAAETYVDSLCASSDTILFSAAHPGQGGDGHYNEQPREYWEEKFARRGFSAIEIKEQFASDERIEPWYRENIVIFRKDVEGK